MLGESPCVWVLGYSVKIRTAYYKSIIKANTVLFFISTYYKNGLI